LLLPTGSSEKEAKCSEAPTVLLETSSADRKRNEKEMKERTIRFLPFVYGSYISIIVVCPSVHPSVCPFRLKRLKVLTFIYQCL